ncbi:hypothetical protein OIU79_027663 [Salix purpurea]|uniref:Uncharacterized protein n=1 Tax=Salix purpurea TaxID=77065 RepID=A0A9Q0VUS7_SALPP|nr:hypothetical protein OIU79_027663 [Salix purpurea]
MHVIVSGSPKLNFHETEFGWGRPEKMEDVSDDKKTRAISLVESRDEKGGIEEAGWPYLRAIQGPTAHFCLWMQCLYELYYSTLECLFYSYAHTK